MANISTVGTTREKVNYGWLALILIAAISVVLYLPTLNGYWVADDYVFVVKKEWPQILNFFNLARGGLFYRPLVWLGYVVNWELWGNNPAMWHLTNVLLNAVVCALLWLLVRRVCNPPIATLVALLFVVSPAHPGAVAWVSGLPDLLSTLLYLACVLAFVRYRQARRRLFYAAALTLLLLAILSKESAVAIPAMIILVDLLFLTPNIRQTVAGSWGKFVAAKVWLYAPFVVISGGYFLLRLWLNAQHLLYFGYNPANNADTNKLGNAMGYLAMTVALDQYVLVASILLLVIFVVFVVAFRNEPLGWLGWGWLVVNIVPVLGYAVDELRTRYVYLASIGICMVLGVMIYQTWQRTSSQISRYVLAAVTVLLLAYGGWATNVHNSEWVTGGQMAQQLLAQVKAAHPTIASGSEFFIINPPLTNKRASVLNIGIPMAVRLVYGDNSLNVYSPSIDPSAFNAAIQQPSNKSRYYFAYQDGQMVEYANAEELLRHRLFVLFLPNT